MSGGTGFLVTIVTVGRIRVQLSIGLGQLVSLPLVVSYESGISRIHLLLFASINRCEVGPEKAVAYACHHRTVLSNA